MICSYISHLLSDQVCFQNTDKPPFIFEALIDIYTLKFIISIDNERLLIELNGKPEIKMNLKGFHNIQLIGVSQSTVHNSFFLRAHTYKVSTHELCLYLNS